MALSKTAILGEGARRTGFQVWPVCNMTDPNRVVRVRACAERTYVSDRAAEVVRTLTKLGRDPGAKDCCVGAGADRV